MDEQHESFGRLLGCLHRQARSYFERELAAYRLGSGTLPVLLALLRHDGSNQQELSERLLVDKASITRAITKLLKQGYVRREKDATDLRAYRVFVTSKTQDIAPEIKAVLHSWTDILTQDFTEDEKQAAGAFLKRMRENALQEKPKEG